MYVCVDHICKSSEYIFKAPEKLKKKKWRSVHLQGAFLMNMKPSVKKIELFCRQEKIFHVNR